MTGDATNGSGIGISLLVTTEPELKMFRAVFIIFLKQALALPAVAEMAADQDRSSKVDERAAFLDCEWTGTGSFFLGKE